MFRNSHSVTISRSISVLTGKFLCDKRPLHKIHQKMQFRNRQFSNKIKIVYVKVRIVKNSTQSKIPNEDSLQAGTAAGLPLGFLVDSCVYIRWIQWQHPAAILLCAVDVQQTQRAWTIVVYGTIVSPHVGVRVIAVVIKKVLLHPI